jgi:hypothetical protein
LRSPRAHNWRYCCSSVHICQGHGSGDLSTGIDSCQTKDSNLNLPGSFSPRRRRWWSARCWRPASSTITVAAPGQATAAPPQVTGLPTSPPAPATTSPSSQVRSRWCDSKDNKKNNINKEACSRGAWSSDGCTTLSDSATNVTTCACNHLSVFSGARMGHAAVTYVPTPA